jgi:hypothetical protein
VLAQRNVFRKRIAMASKQKTCLKEKINIIEFQASNTNIGVRAIADKFSLIHIHYRRNVVFLYTIKNVLFPKNMKNIKNTTTIFSIDNVK